MPFYRKSYGFRSAYKPYRKYSGRRSFSKFSGNWTKRNNRAAANQTQQTNMQVSVVQTQTHTIPLNEDDATTTLNLASVLTLSTMHIALSNVYDQYRIRKIVIKVTPTGVNPSPGNIYYTLSSAVDRNQFGANTTTERLMTYSSFKQTPYSSTASNRAPTHYISISQDTLFAKSAYYSTKGVAVTPHIALSTRTPSNLAAETEFKYSICFQFDITYRGVRLDTSAIDASVDNPE